MHVVTLMLQPDERTAHADDIVVGVRREDQHRFREWAALDRTEGIVGIGLAAGPSGNCMLEVVENVYVQLVVAAYGFQETFKGVLEIVLTGELEYGLPDLAAQPDNGLAAELGCPVARTDEPRGDETGKVAGGHVIDIQLDIGVTLEEAGGDIRSHFPLGDLAHHFGLAFTPGQQDDLLGAEHGAEAHCNGLLGGD